MPRFELQADVHKNVFALRKALGSVVQRLSTAALGALISEKHPTRKISASQVQRWEDDGIEPDYISGRIMAEMAGVPFDAFVLGERRVDSARIPGTRATDPTQARPIGEGEDQPPAVAPKRKRG